jgi:hypothetical protein
VGLTGWVRRSGRCAHRLGDELRDAGQREGQDVLLRIGAGQVQPDLSFHFDDARRDLDEPKPQRVELRVPPDRPLRHQRAQAPQEPIGAGMQE